MIPLIIDFSFSIDFLVYYILRKCDVRKCARPYIATVLMLITRLSLLALSPVTSVLNM